jgi:hypothetical protein
MDWAIYTSKLGMKEEILDKHQFQSIASLYPPIGDYAYTNLFKMDKIKKLIIEKHIIFTNTCLILRAKQI